MTDPDETKPYRIEARRGIFQIVDAAGEVILANNDEANANQYVALLNQTYRRGYKAGYREAKQLKR